MPEQSIPRVARDLRRHVGLDVALEALRDYLRKHRGGIDALVAAAKADRIYPFMRPYMEALA
jgi:hypothetical protein